MRSTMLWPRGSPQAQRCRQKSNCGERGNPGPVRRTLLVRSVHRGRPGVFAVRIRLHSRACLPAGSYLTVMPGDRGGPGNEVDDRAGPWLALRRRLMKMLTLSCGPRRGRLDGACGAFELPSVTNNAKRSEQGLMLRFHCTDCRTFGQPREPPDACRCSSSSSTTAGRVETPPSTCAAILGWAPARIHARTSGVAAPDRTASGRSVRLLRLSGDSSHGPSHSSLSSCRDNCPKCSGNHG